jgi:hypothetical protein
VETALAEAIIDISGHERHETTADQWDSLKRLGACSLELRISTHMPYERKILEISYGQYYGKESPCSPRCPESEDFGGSGT